MQFSVGSLPLQHGQPPELKSTKAHPSSILIGNFAQTRELSSTCVDPDLQKSGLFFGYDLHTLIDLWNDGDESQHAAIAEAAATA